jgi:hypothetical protein
LSALVENRQLLLHAGACSDRLRTAWAPVSATWSADPTWKPEDSDASEGWQCVICACILMTIQLTLAVAITASMVAPPSLYLARSGCRFSLQGCSSNPCRCVSWAPTGAVRSRCNNNNDIIRSGGHAACLAPCRLGECVHAGGAETIWRPG